MNAIQTTANADSATEGMGSVSTASRLSEEQRIFCETFTANGGRADLAAVAAGVDPSKAAVQGSRWLCRKAVADHIKSLCGTFAHSLLPLAISTLGEVAGDKEALRKDRIKAANSLLDIAEMSRQPGGLQVNVGIVNGSQAQQIISEVHQLRSRRLSDIPPAMPDTTQSIEASAERLSIEPPATQAGGDHLQGPAAGTGSLPVSPSEHSRETDVSDPGAAFRAAFDEGDDDGDNE